MAWASSRQAPLLRLPSMGPRLRRADEGRRRCYCSASAYRSFGRLRQARHRLDTPPSSATLSPSFGHSSPGTSSRCFRIVCPCERRFRPWYGAAGDERSRRASGCSHGPTPRMASAISSSASIRPTAPGRPGSPGRWKRPATRSSSRTGTSRATSSLRWIGARPVAPHHSRPLARLPHLPLCRPRVGGPLRPGCHERARPAGPGAGAPE